MLFNEIHSLDDLCTLVNEVGFLPLFANEIEGFSVEECTPPELWFTDADGPWEWKGPVIQRTSCAYGKFFRNKAGFISKDKFPDFANFRRDGYDYEGFYYDGFAKNDDKYVYDILEERGELISKELKRLGGFRKGGRKGFDGIITRLQMQTFVITTDFVYMRDKYGKQYGWGVAKYASPEQFYGGEFTERTYARKPEESKRTLIDYWKGLLPRASEKDIFGLLGVK